MTTIGPNPAEIPHVPSSLEEKGITPKDLAPAALLPRPSKATVTPQKPSDSAKLEEKRKELTGVDFKAIAPALGKSLLKTNNKGR